MLPPLFPVYIPGIEKLHPYGTLIWLGGVILLWLTRYTHQLGRRWGWLYYGLSVVIRPLGILGIVVGWLALFSPYPSSLFGRFIPLSRYSTAEIISLMAILLFFGLGVWSVAVLGVRRSFFFRHVDDTLITRGPYALVRHPQFLSAIGIVLFSFLFYFDMQSRSLGGFLTNPGLDVALFTLSLWLLSILEEKELISHFGDEYREYMKQVPRLFPN